MFMLTARDLNLKEKWWKVIEKKWKQVIQPVLFPQGLLYLIKLKVFIFK